MSARSAPRVLCVLLLLACALGIPQAQQPAPSEASPGARPTQAEQAQPPVTFRAEINYVEVNAVVADAKGTHVGGLTLNDFDVFEDGKLQKVTVFGHVNIPIQRSPQPLYATSPIELDVQTNEQRDGRLYMLVLDSLHTDPLNGLRVKNAAKAFIEQRFGANDLAAVIHTSGKSDLGQDFTNNRRLLLASIDKFVGDPLQSMTLAKLESFNNSGITRQTNPVNSTQRSALDPDEFQRQDYAKRTARQLERLADYLSGIRGRRKSLIFISEGFPYDLADTSTTVPDAMRDAIGAAQRANVSIFAVDPRGLSTGMELGIQVSGFDSAQANPDGSDSRADTRALGIGLEALMSESRIAQDGLRALAQETGGIAAVNRNDFKGIFDQIVQENSTYYVLGYYAPPERRDGKFHRIEVKVKRPGVTVRTRRGYQAPRGKKPDVKASQDIPAALREAINSPIPMPGIPLRAFAAPFKGTPPNALVAVSVEMRGADFKYAEANGTFNDVVTVQFTPIDQTGSIKNAKRSKATLPLKPDQHALALNNGIRIVSSLELPPGRYQIRMSAGEDGAQRSGTVLYDLEVPNFTKLPMSMSGVTLSAASAGQMVTVGSEGPLAAMLAGPTLATREFDRSDTLKLYAEFYENTPEATPHKIDLSVTIRADDGRTVFQAREERSSTELQGGRGGYGYAPQIPLKDIAPGTYVIHVEARSRTANAPGIGRDIQVRVK